MCFKALHSVRFEVVEQLNCKRGISVVLLKAPAQGDAKDTLNPLVNELKSGIDALL